MVLALGMMISEFNRTEFVDPDEEASLEKPPHVSGTPLGLEHLDQLMNTMRAIW